MVVGLQPQPLTFTQDHHKVVPNRAPRDCLIVGFALDNQSTSLVFDICCCSTCDLIVQFNLPLFGTLPYNSNITKLNQNHHDWCSCSPALLLSDKLMTIINLTIRVRVLLDVDEMNYSSRMYFFQNMCRGYDLLNHILGETKTTNDASSSELTPPTAEWLAIDSIILTWIFTALSKTLQQRLVVKNPKMEKEAWDILALIFNDNKRSYSIALKAELRSMKLEHLIIDAYFRKIESILTILLSLGSLIRNDDVVNISLDEEPDKYQHVSDIIIHQDPFPNLKTVRSMLTTAEMRLKSRAQATFVDYNSSSPMVLLANSGINTWRSTPSTEKVNKPFFNFNKGSCRFGEYCKFLHNGVHDDMTHDDMRTLQNNLAKLGFDGNSTTTKPFGSGSSVGSSGYFGSFGSTSRTRDAIIECFSCCDSHGSCSEKLEHGYSTRDLYPITKPSTIPHAFLAIQYTWHQRLGHPEK
nr:hybrid signal transduction histidine kinase M [Tanacetum cinerariifolium]